MKLDSNYKELEEKIQVVLDERNRKQRIENRLAYIDDLLRAYEKELAILSSILNKEERDYLKVQRNTVLKLLTRLYSDYDKLLNKEYQEYVIAYSTYYDQVQRIETLKNEHQILTVTLSGLFRIEEQLNALLRQKESILKKINPDFAKKVQEYERRISARKLFIKELHQAHRAGTIAHTKLKRLFSDFNNLIEMIKKLAFIHTLPFSMRTTLREIQLHITSSVESLDIYSAELQDVSKKYRLPYQDELHDLQRFLKHLITRLMIDFVQRKELSGTLNFIEDLMDETSMMQMTLLHEIEETNSALERDKLALQEIATEF